MNYYLFCVFVNQIFFQKSLSTIIGALALSNIFNKDLFTAISYLSFRSFS